jgi:hypothetical protein
MLFYSEVQEEEKLLNISVQPQDSQEVTPNHTQEEEAEIKKKNEEIIFKCILLSYLKFQIKFWEIY